MNFKNIKFLAFFLLLSQILFSQTLVPVFSPKVIDSIPFATSNNAVCMGLDSNMQPTMFSFGGIDTSLQYSGIHLKSVGYTLGSRTVYTLSDLPDTMGKIAAAATCLGRKIYIIGGYHVLANGTEVSSNKVHCFNLDSMAFEADKAPLPLPIDDHVQVAYQDKYIYVISGWSNTGNVGDIQIYDTEDNIWLHVQNAFPSPTYEVFGASGNIDAENGRIIYYSGMKQGIGFSMSFQMRIGTIDENDPRIISWEDSTFTGFKGRYRGVCVEGVDGKFAWLGGSNVGYNYDALAYSNGQTVEPDSTYLGYSGWYSNIWAGIEDQKEFYKEKFDQPNIHLMDLRGYGGSYDYIYTLGGITKNRKVVPWLVQWKDLLGSVEENVFELKIIPNPANNHIWVETELNVDKLELYNLEGKLLQSSYANEMELMDLTNGLYIVKVHTARGVISKKIMVNSF